MSLLFDSLRKGRSRRDGAGARPTQADAVLATLGYVPQRRGTGTARVLLLGLAAVAAVALGVWFWPSAGPAQLSQPARRPAQSRPQLPATQTRTTPGQIAQPSAPSGSTAIAPTSSAPAPGLARQEPPAISQPAARVPQMTPSAPPATTSTAQTPVRPAPAPTRSDEPARQTQLRPEPSAPAPVEPPRAAPTRTAPPRIEASPESRPVAPARPPLGRAEPRTLPGAVEPRRAAALPADEFRLALYYHRAGDLEKALTHYRAVLAQNELNAEAHNNLGLLYQQRGLLEDSVREFQRATFINARYGRAHTNLGVTYMRQSRLDMAVAEFELALSLDPRDSDAMVNLALAQKARRQDEAARTTLLRALTIDPGNAAAHYNLGLFYDESGEVARAVEHYRAFLEHAGTEHATLAGEVRSRVGTLSASLR